METYIIFVRDNTVGADFVAMRRAPSGQHQAVIAAMTRKYPQPGYTVQTTYTYKELEAMMADMRRWCGPAMLAGEQPSQGRLVGSRRSA